MSESSVARSTRIGGVIDAVFFDLDGTLLREEEHDATYHAAQALAGRYGLDGAELAAVAAIARRDGWLRYGARWMRGEADDDTLARGIWHLVLEQFDREDLVDDAVELHLAAEQETHTLYAEVKGVLQSLRRDGLLLGVITNGSSTQQRAKLEWAGIAEYFTVVVTSGDVGVTKPEEAIFRRALDRMGVIAERAIFVGDDFRKDVVGAAAVGMHPLWLNRAEVEPPATDISYRMCDSLWRVLSEVPAR